MFNISALFTVLLKGQELSDPAKWKNRQVTVTMLAGFVAAVLQLAQAKGWFPVPVDAETINAMAGGFIAVINLYLTLGTSKKVGLGKDVSASGQAVDGSGQF